MVPAMQRASRNPPKMGGERKKEEGVPSYEAIIQGHTGGRKKERKREDKTRRSQLCTSHPGTRQEGGLGVAAEVPGLVVVDFYALMDKALTCVVFCLMAASALWLLRRATTSIKHFAMKMSISSM